MCYDLHIYIRFPKNILLGNNIISWVHDIAYAMLRSFIVENQIIISFRFLCLFSVTFDVSFLYVKGKTILYPVLFLYALCRIYSYGHKLAYGHTQNQFIDVGLILWTYQISLDHKVGYRKFPLRTLLLIYSSHGIRIIYF